MIAGSIASITIECSYRETEIRVRVVSPKVSLGPNRGYMAASAAARGRALLEFDKNLSSSVSWDSDD
jgi:hypothetical protein